MAALMSVSAVSASTPERGIDAVKESAQDALIKELQDEVADLKTELNHVDHRATAGNNGAWWANQRLDTLLD
jgi:hypothetical protein